VFIRSERLFLRPGWPEDWQELATLIADDGVVRNLASVPWPYTGADARRFLDQPQERFLPRFLITLPGAEGGRLIGSVGLERRGEDIELGYWIARSHWGRGFASEAARATIRLARAIGHERLVASHFVDNPASGRVLEKNRFTQTGRIVDRYSLGRGTACPAREYALDLGTPGDCDDDMDGSGSSVSPKRAA
jgi:RimJ/RimL family protein N-acetyltransferase